MKEFSYQTRKENLQRLKEEVFDLVIIGGGITGAGVAREAASRGLKIAVIEADDFASGTSSRSSKLIHGGIRYLENFEFHLVFEALSERALLFKIAPHLVHHLRFVLPVYENSRVGFFKMGLGVFLYDLLSLFRAPQRYEKWNSSQTSKNVAGIESAGLKGAYVYSDGYVDDDRMVLETLRSAHSLTDIAAVNYCEVLSGNFKKDKLESLEVKDHKSNEVFRVSAHHFISTVGPWTDVLGQDLFSNWKEILRPTKGIHMTFERSRVPLKRAVVMAVDKEKRIVFAIPRHEMVIIGTTDTDYTNNPREVKSLDEDIQYLLNVANEYFPGLGLTTADIISSYSGIRPLVHDGSSSEGKTSREHRVINHPSNITFVAGGKYTTYRKMSEDIVESVREYLPRETPWRPSRTKRPLNPKITAASYQKELLALEKLHVKEMPKEDLKLLVERYGGEWRSIYEKHLEKAKSYSKEDLPFMWCLEALHAIDSTMCLGVRDFYLRRVPLFLAKKDHGFSFLDGLTFLFKKELELSEEASKEDRASLDEHLKSEMGWRKNEG